MNTFERTLWEIKVWYHKHMMHLYTISGNQKMVNRHWLKVVEMVNVYFDVFLP